MKSAKMYEIYQNIRQNMGTGQAVTPDSKTLVKMPVFYIGVLSFRLSLLFDVPLSLAAAAHRGQW